MVFHLPIFINFFHKWANLVVAITGFLGTAMLGISAALIPWGLRLPKNRRHPFKKKPTVNNSCNQSTSCQQEWWGCKLKFFGWSLLSISFFIQIFVAWQDMSPLCLYP